MAGLTEIKAYLAIPESTWLTEWLTGSLTHKTADLEKVVDHPQAENSELYNVLKIARFATKDEQKYVYQMLVWHDQILKSWVPIQNFEF